jgi:hypothetical protein
MKCEKLLFEENSNSKPKPIENKRFMNDNPQELDVNQNISDEYEKIMNLVKRETKNLNQLESEMDNFKKKLSKLTNANNRVDWQAKQNENNFEFNQLKPEENFKRETPASSNEMIGNMDLRNINLSNLQNLLTMNLLKKKQSDSNITQATNNQNLDANFKSVNLNVNDEQILKKLLNSENKKSNGGDNNPTAEVNKNEKTQVENVSNKVSENVKESLSNLSGMSLTEIEKQIIMLKSLADK